jgi:ABC-type polysaccharide/polyol phosphate transport system ATPase subunit
MRGHALGDAALRLEGISKRYRLRVAPNTRILDFGFWILDWAGKGVSGPEPLPLSSNPKSKRPEGTRNPKWKEFWALQELSLSVQPGELVAVIGSNGAGKSTLFKLIAGVTTPTRGWLAQRGRLGALIEVGAGIHPELTGRENIYQYGSILGLSWREIRQRFDAIVQFADLEGFIDQPVKRYSSGMQMRLGFSVAASVEPDVLLVDEVLAVGDEGFQTRCLERIDSLRRSGTAILFASHDLAAVERMGDRAIWLDHGRMVMSGLPGPVAAAYRAKEN